MKLSELKATVDFTIECLRDYESPDDIEVLITLSDNSVGARASSTVRYAGMGIDFEHGQFRIAPGKRLVTMGNGLQDIKPAGYKVYEGRKYYYCQRCGNKVSKDDFYCRSCSQKLR